MGHWFKGLHYAEGAYNIFFISSTYYEAKLPVLETPFKLMQSNTIASQTTALIARESFRFHKSIFITELLHGIFLQSTLSFLVTQCIKSIHSPQEPHIHRATTLWAGQMIHLWGEK